MALFRRCDPDGVDKVIDSLQRDLFVELEKNFGWTKYDSYDRVYRNKKGSDIIPEAYIGKGEYVEVLLNDKINVTSFFLADEKRVYDYKKFVFTQTVSFIVQADLKKLFPDLKNRGDEKMIDDVWKAIGNIGWNSNTEEIVTGVEKVYDSLKLSYDKKYYDDMSRFSVARFNITMIYINNNCTTQAL